MQNEREQLDSRFNQLEDPEAIVRDVAKKFVVFKEQISERYDDELKFLKDSNRQIWSENLLIPNLIGELIYETKKEKNLPLL
jgi:hypothetical protein